MPCNKGKYKITVTRGKTRTEWGGGYTKTKAKKLVKTLTGKSHIKNPRIKKY